jgi:hypothetical protein
MICTVGNFKLLSGKMLEMVARYLKLSDVLSVRCKYQDRSGQVSIKVSIPELQSLLNILCYTLHPQKIRESKRVI